MSRAPRRLALLMSLLLVAGPAAVAGPEPDERVVLDRALIEATRGDLPLDRRLAAAAVVLQSEAWPDPDAAVAAGTSLLTAAADPACWLILRGADAGWIDPRYRADLTRALAEAGDALPAKDAVGHARLTACGLLVGLREPGLADTLTASWPPAPFARAVLEREVGALADADGRAVLEGNAAAAAAALREQRAVAVLLDQATADEPEVMAAGLDGLVGLGARAVPLLLHEAAQGARGAPPGRMPRAARAILALGTLHDRRATGVLADALRSPDGWVRVAAATALGDLGDPAGAVPLVEHLCTLGDLFRARDQWEYPGASDTTIAEEDWATIDYFAVDDAAADALLRLGVPRAAGYLIHEKLDPSRKYWRIRVLQDAVDALRRSVPSLPAGITNVDAGLPQRDAAFVELATWWHTQRDRPDLVRVRLDEDDPGFRQAARALAEHLRGKDVRQFMITKPACALLGTAMTPTLLETLASTTRGAARTELAEALGLVRDVRAVPALLGLLKDERPFVRAAATEALGTYVDRDAAVIPALLTGLEDPREGPRVSAMKALAGAPPRPTILQAVIARRETDRAQGRGRSESYTTAEQVVLLVQEGERHWEAVAAGLASPQRFTREAWWAILRRALDLPAWMHEANAEPDASDVRRLAPDRALARLRERRAR